MFIFTGDLVRSVFNCLLLQSSLGKLSFFKHMRITIYFYMYNDYFFTRWLLRINYAVHDFTALLFLPFPLLNLHLGNFPNCPAYQGLKRRTSSHMVLRVTLGLGLLLQVFTGGLHLHYCKKIMCYTDTK